MLEIILVHGFFPLKIKITELANGFCINFAYTWLEITTFFDIPL